MDAELLQRSSGVVLQSGLVPRGTREFVFQRIFTVFLVYPLLYGFWMSLHEWNALFPDRTKFIGLGNYEAMFADSIPLAAFEVSDLAAEFERLTARGVAFTREPTAMGPVQIAVFSDTCGNLIQLYQPG